MELNARQKRFAHEYLIDSVASRAAVRAGYNPNTGYKLLRCKCVADYISERQREMREKSQITREKIINELAAIGFANGADFIKIVQKDKSDACDKSGKIEVSAVSVVDTDDIPAEKLAAVASIKKGTYGVEVKLYDKTKALDMLCKLLGYYESDGAERHNNEVAMLYKVLEERR